MSLELYRPKQLAKYIGVSLDRIEKVADNVEGLCEVYLLTNPGDPAFKERKVRNITGDLRTIQSQIHKRILLPKLIPSQYSYGCIRSRTIKDNIAQHAKSSFALAMDFSNFFPSIHYSRIYKMLANRLGCKPDVARLMTKLCTVEHHLALGLITSPILANEVLYAFDKRLAAACSKMNLIYTRYVDDITISGQYDLNPHKSGIADLVTRIAKENGLRINPDKSRHGTIGDVIVTGLQIRKGKIDVHKDYVRELNRRIADANELSKDGLFEGPFFTENQIRGQIQFVSWINPNRRFALVRKFRSIKWRKVHELALKRGYIRSKTKLIRLSDVTENVE